MTDSGRGRASQSTYLPAPTAAPRRLNVSPLSARRPWSLELLFGGAPSLLPGGDERVFEDSKRDTSAEGGVPEEGYFGSPGNRGVRTRDEGWFNDDELPARPLARLNSPGFWDSSRMAALHSDQLEVPNGAPSTRENTSAETSEGTAHRQSVMSASAPWVTDSPRLSTSSDNTRPSISSSGTTTSSDGSLRMLSSEMRSMLLSESTLEESLAQLARDPVRRPRRSRLGREDRRHAAQASKQEKAGSKLAGTIITARPSIAPTVEVTLAPDVPAEPTAGRSRPAAETSTAVTVYRRATRWCRQLSNSILRIGGRRSSRGEMNEFPDAPLITRPGDN